jgi:hypothetical protein
MAKLTLPLTEADTVLFLEAKTAAGFGHLSNLAALRSILIGLKGTQPKSKPTKEEVTQNLEGVWVAITPALNSPHINAYWKERKEEMCSCVTPSDPYGASPANTKKRLQKAEWFHQDYIAWQEGDNTLCEVPFNPATDPKFLCDAS